MAILIKTVFLWSYNSVYILDLLLSNQFATFKLQNREYDLLDLQCDMINPSFFITLFIMLTKQKCKKIW